MDRRIEQTGEEQLSMEEHCARQICGAMSQEDFQRLAALGNDRLVEFLADAIQLCQPDSVVVLDDSEEARNLSRRMAVEAGEEKPLATPGHTVHFDGIHDQGRDREATRYLVPVGDHLSAALNQIEREEGLAEVRGLLAGSMRGRTMIVRFLCLGPVNSPFSIPCVECTDSWYVSHSLDLLYRPGYEEFRRIGNSPEFFAIVHSAGRLDHRNTSAEPDKKRIYIDYLTDTVYSINTQYAGNSIGLKKLALRLTIRKAEREGWLAEHMLLMGVHGPGGRKTYFAGAFPSACGKTSTAMLPTETVLADDIAYIRNLEGECRAANAESGIFGILKGVNDSDDPLIWDVLHKPGEVIFSNVLVHQGRPYWLEMGDSVTVPEQGENFAGAWRNGDRDEKGEQIPHAHKNARYAVALRALANCDPDLDSPLGVPLRGIMYGGRDSKALVPVQQSFSWSHGIIMFGAALESETTFAIVDQKEGVPEINLMSIQDFISLPLGKYIENNLAFATGLREPPLIFGVNYFLRCRKTDGRMGNFLNSPRDKHVWIKWMERRVHSEVGAIRTPTGLIPRYDDLAPLFREIREKEYSRDDYVEQFTIRVPENLAKIERVAAFYRQEVSDTPAKVFETLEAQQQRLLRAQKRFGDYVAPDRFLQEPDWDQP